jgi:hypothetical protein
MATQMMDKIDKDGLQELWKFMSDEHKNNLKKKNYLISYKNETIDGNGYHILPEPPLKVIFSSKSVLFYF